MIRFDGVSKVYRSGNRPALHDATLEVKPGEFVFLVGASGSGKSSFLRLILREERASSGLIHVLGQDLGRLSNRKVPSYRRNLGVVFQDFRLLPSKTVFDNVAFALRVLGQSEAYIHDAVPEADNRVNAPSADPALPDPPRRARARRPRGAIEQVLQVRHGDLPRPRRRARFPPRSPAGWPAPSKCRSGHRSRSPQRPARTRRRASHRCSR